MEKHKEHSPCNCPVCCLIRSMTIFGTSKGCLIHGPLYVDSFCKNEPSCRVVYLGMKTSDKAWVRPSNP